MLTCSNMENQIINFELKPIDFYSCKHWKHQGSTTCKMNTENMKKELQYSLSVPSSAIKGKFFKNLVLTRQDETNLT